MTDDERAGREQRGPDLPDTTDPEVAAALARTRADLAAHGARTPAMPAGLLAGIDRALAAERTPATPHPGNGDGDGGDVDRRDDGPDAPVRSPAGRRRVLLGAALALTAAAAVVAVVVAVVVATVTSVGSPATPGPAPTAAPVPDVPVLSGGDGVSALRAGLGRVDYGPLADAGRLAGCLAAHGVPPGTRPVGARQVVVDGRAGVLLVLPTGTAARFRLLVVAPGCGPDAPLTVSDTLVGR